MTILIILASIIGLGAISSTVYLLVVAYNHLMKTRVNVDQQFANIDVLLKQRADEIPELVKILKASMAYDAQQIDSLMGLYQQYQKSDDMKDKLQLNQQIETLLKATLPTVQHVDFLGLKQRLTEIETQLRQRREKFNDSVATFNALILRIPYILLAAMLNLEACQYFEISEADKDYHGVDLI